VIPVDVLTRPITELVSSFGTGALPADGPPEALAVASAALDSAYALGKLGLAELGGAWTGVAAEAAVTKGEQAQAQQVQLSEQGTEIAKVVTAASEVVGAGLVELQGIAASFVSTAISAGPALTTPAGQMMIVASAIDHLSRGLSVVARVRGELDVHTAALAQFVTPEPVAAPSPIGDIQTVVSQSTGNPLAGLQERGDSMGAFVQHFVDAAKTAPNPFGDGPLFPGQDAEADAGAPAALGSSDFGSSDFGSSGGVQIQLPDGSTATAPNAEAANAVRNALSQQGVPYSWGGTSPGQGLDCSGLTQWAYGEAGIDLPRTAQEQTVGLPIDSADLMPGDLAVWDGHVAMVIGNGQMVEAGDPVQVSSVRTANIGMGFYGFYRPTA
jgi:peptidoglycan DL-endopeptidase CwlO